MLSSTVEIFRRLNKRPSTEVLGFESDGGVFRFKSFAVAAVDIAALRRCGSLSLSGNDRPRVPEVGSERAGSGGKNWGQRSQRLRFLRPRLCLLSVGGDAVSVLGLN